MHDWSALRKHISSGQCSRLKSRTATGQSLDEMWHEVRQQECADPPSPPHGLDSGQAVPEEVWLRKPLQDILNRVELLDTLRKACAICGQRLISMQKIKTHWRQTHAVAWRCVQAEIEGEMASLQAVVQKPCQFCGSKAVDSGVWPPGRWLDRGGYNRSGRSPLVRKRGRTSPVRLTPVTRSRTHPLVRHWGWLARVRQGARGEAVGAAMGAEQPGAGNGLRRRGAGPVWTPRLMINPGNHCYANASILAVCHACALARCVPPALRPLVEYLRSRAQFGLRTVLSETPALRAISGHWEYNGEQQDASEYIGVVLGAAGVLTRVWCSRLEVDGIISATDYGHAVLLEMPEQIFRPC